MSEMGGPKDRIKLGPSGAQRSTCSDSRVLLGSRESGACGEAGVGSKDEADEAEEDSDMLRERLRCIAAAPRSAESRVKWGRSRPEPERMGPKRGAEDTEVLVDVDCTGGSSPLVTSGEPALELGFDESCLSESCDGDPRPSRAVSGPKLGD